MWPNGKSFFSRSPTSSSISSSKNRAKDKEGEKEKEKEPGGNRKVKETASKTSLPMRPVERPRIHANTNRLATVPAHLRGSSPGMDRERETRGCEAVGGSETRRMESNSSPLLPSHPPAATGHHRRDETTSAPPPITVTTEETVLPIEEDRSGTLTGNQSEDDEPYSESDAKMSLNSLVRPPPPGFEKDYLLKKNMGIKEEEEEITISTESMGEAFMQLFHSQPTSVKAKIKKDLITQKREYVTRYRQFHHADRTEDIRLVNSIPPPAEETEATETGDTAKDIQTDLTPSEYHAAHKLLARKRSDWHLRKYMLFDSPAYKTHIADLRKRHGDPSNRDNCLEFFFGIVLSAWVVGVEGADAGLEEGSRASREKLEWTPRILQKREELIEHGIYSRENREEDGRGALYSVSGPAVRKRKLARAEENLVARDVCLNPNLDLKRGDGGSERRNFERMSPRPELRMRRGRTESMAVTVGGTPERDYSTLDDVGLGHLSAERLAGFGVDSPRSEASERDDAHVDALRFALSGLSNLQQHQNQHPQQHPHAHQPKIPAQTSTSPLTMSVKPPAKQENTRIPPKNPRRQTKTWEPISTTDLHRESLDRDHQKARRDPRGDQSGSDSDDNNNSEDSTSDIQTTDPRERLSEAEIEEARRIVEHAKAKKKKRGEERERAELERGMDRTNVEKSFRGRRFF
ncbi:hypothetical protein E2P81_ATG11115 [Venturia nashicola]|uniref:Uncharacterized protein n=1 Tax=Venturia nashicola TaxID=86259 RepID=A0A4Z1P5V7_9PEZI|nr:hypothetical protein E6O75_ATG10792 [Venturia nashicola]TLD34996.1 hypothetical protein E2P81_ATG11115 [Venturia nashicola]